MALHSSAHCGVRWCNKPGLKFKFSQNDHFCTSSQSTKWSAGEKSQLVLPSYSFKIALTFVSVIALSCPIWKLSLTMFSRILYLILVAYVMLLASWNLLHRHVVPCTYPSLCDICEEESLNTFSILNINYVVLSTTLLRVFNTETAKNLFTIILHCMKIVFSLTFVWL